MLRPVGLALRALLGQGVSRAVLLASAKTHKKLRGRKQRTYRRSFVRVGYPTINCPASHHTMSVAHNSTRSPPEQSAGPHTSTLASLNHTADAPSIDCPP